MEGGGPVAEAKSLATEILSSVDRRPSEDTSSSMGTVQYSRTGTVPVAGTVACEIRMSAIALELAIGQFTVVRKCLEFSGAKERRT